MDSGAYASLSSIKTSGWSGLQIGFHGRKQVTKDGSDFRKTIIMDIGTTTTLSGNPNMIIIIREVNIPMHFMTNAGSKIVYEVGEINGSGQTKFYPDMIANVLSQNKITKKYRVTFDSGDQNDFRVHIGDHIVKVIDNDAGIYFNQPDTFLGKWINITEGT